MEEVSVSRFKATCLKLLQQVKLTGRPILVTRRGEPLAEVVPPPRQESRRDWLGSARGTGVIKGDLLAPLPEEDWEALKP